MNVGVERDTTYDIESEIGKSIATSGKQLNSKFQNYYTKSQIDGGGSNANVNTSNLNAQAAKLVDASKTTLKSALDGAYAAKGHNHDGAYAKLDASNLNNDTNKKKWRDALTVGTSALGGTAGYTNLWESVSSLKALAEGKADSDHAHSDYLTGSVSNGVITLANNETNGKFSQTTYTKSQVDALLNGKQNTIPGGTYAASEHSHDNAYTKKDATNLDDSNKTAWRTALTVGSSGDEAEADSTTSAWARIKANESSLSALSGKVGALETSVGDDKGGLVKAVADAKAASDANAAAISALDAATVKSSEFGSIGYAGLEEGEADVYPTSYRAGGVPSLHEPERDGYEFAGWSWSRTNADGSQESGDGTNLAEAFSAAGRVTLTAEWSYDVPEANHFFTGDAPLRAGDASDYQTSVIRVRLSDAAGRLDRVGFSRDDATGLLKDDAALALWVGSDPDVTAEGKGTRLDLAGDGAATSSGWSLELAELGPDSWGVYVGVRVKTSDVNESPVESFTEGSYVASLVKMSYRFA